MDLLWSIFWYVTAWCALILVLVIAGATIVAAWRGEMQRLRLEREREETDRTITFDRASAEHLVLARRGEAPMEWR